MDTPLDDAMRETFRRIADHLVPEAEGMPSASQVDVHGVGLDRVLALRGELGDDLRRGLAAAGPLDGAAAAEHLAEHDPAALAVVGLIATSAYYMTPGARRALGYPGQLSRPVTGDEEGDYLVDGLLQPVINRGPIYRPTPDVDAQ